MTINAPEMIEVGPLSDARSTFSCLRSGHAQSTMMLQRRSSNMKRAERRWKKGETRVAALRGVSPVTGPSIAPRSRHRVAFKRFSTGSTSPPKREQLLGERRWRPGEDVHELRVPIAVQIVPGLVARQPGPGGLAASRPSTLTKRSGPRRSSSIPTCAS